MLGQAGDGEQAGDRAQGKQELVVAERLDLVFVRGQLDRPGGRVVAGDGTQAQVGASQDVAKRRHDVPGLEGARRSLGQERRVEQEVDVIHEGQSGRLAWHQ